MNEEDLNIKYIREKTGLVENDELIPIILEMIQESYKAGLCQAEFDNTMNLIEENQQLKEQLERSEKARKEAIEYVKKRNFDRAEILVDMECEYYYDDDFKDSLLYILEKSDK